MFGGEVIIAILIQLAIFIGVIVFAVKLVNRLQEISNSQESIASSQMKMVELLANKKQADHSTENQI
jgi:Tfp pilus assembly protein PilV